MSAQADKGVAVSGEEKVSPQATDEVSYDKITYSYDSRGNILSKTYLLDDATVDTVTYNYTDSIWADRLTSINLPLSGEMDSAQAEDGGVVSTTITYGKDDNMKPKIKKIAIVVAIIAIVIWGEFVAPAVLPTTTISVAQYGIWGLIAGLAVFVAIWAVMLIAAHKMKERNKTVSRILVIAVALQILAMIVIAIGILIG